MIDIRATHRMARSPYAELGPPPANRPVIMRTDTRTQEPYVTIQPHATPPVLHYTGSHYTGSDNENKEKTATVEGLPTVESVMALLYDMAGRWKEIAGALGFDEDLIDEIDTNNETDEACLQDCVEKWVSRMRPSREQLSLILTDLERNGEPEREGEGQGRQTTDSSSSGIGSDGSPETQSSSDGGRDEMVSGVEETTVSTDSNSDESRKGKTVIPDDCPRNVQDTGPVILTSPTLQEMNPIINEDDDQESGDEGSMEAEVPATSAIVGNFRNNWSFPRKTMMPDDCSGDEQDAVPVILSGRTLQEETPIISENEDQENENEESEMVTCSIEAKEERATSATVVNSHNNWSSSGKTMIPDNCSRGEQDAGPIIFTSPTLQEETPIIISENEDQENKNEMAGMLICSMEAEEEEATIADIANFYKNCLCTSVTYVVDESACCVGLNLSLFPLEQHDDDPTFTKTMVDGDEFSSDSLCPGSHVSFGTLEVGERGSRLSDGIMRGEDYHRFFVCPGNLQPVPLCDTPKAGERDSIARGTTSLTTQNTKADEALEVSKKATGACSTDSVTKPQPPKPTRPRRSASRKSNRKKKKKKRGSPSPPARRNAKVLDHSRLMRIKVKKSSGNLPVD